MPDWLLLVLLHMDLFSRRDEVDFQGTHRLARIRAEGLRIAQDHTLLVDHYLPVERCHLQKEKRMSGPLFMKPQYSGSALMNLGDI